MSFERVEIGPHVLYLGDCLEVLPTLERVDAVVIDPPYGMNWNTDQTRFTAGNTKRGKGVKKPRIIGDDKPFDPRPFLSAPECVMFGANHFWNDLPPGGSLIWLKRNDWALGSFLSDAEIAFIKGRSGVYAYRQTWTGSCRAVDANCVAHAESAHPTQKPIGLMRWVLGYVKSTVVTDFYMGSGSTGVACVREGRRFVGVEINKRYFDTACRRIEDAMREPDMFADPPRATPTQLDLPEVGA